MMSISSNKLILLLGALVGSADAGLFRGATPHATPEAKTPETAQRKLQVDPVAFDNFYTVIEDNRLEVDADEGLLSNDFSSGTMEVTDTTESSNFFGDLRVQDDGEFRYEAPSDFLGTDVFTYTVCNVDDPTSTCGTATVFIDVIRDPDRPDADPTANNNDYEIREGETLTVNAEGILANDGTGTPFNRLFVCEEDDSLVDQNSLSIDSDGGFEYEAERCWTGTETFFYRACYEDFPEMESNEARVAIKVVEDPNRPDTPNPSDDSYDIWEATTLDVSTSSSDPRPLLWNDLGGDGLFIDDYSENSGFLGDLDVDSDGSFSYSAESGDKGTFRFTYTVCQEDWDCVGCATATVSLNVITNPNKPTENPQPQSRTIEVVAGDRFRGNVFDGVDFDTQYTLEATYFGSPSVGTLNSEDDGSIEYGNAPVGTESFDYTVCYVEWPDLCATGSITMVTVEGDISAGLDTRQGIATWYEVSWSGSGSGCSAIQPSLTLYCDQGGVMGQVDAGNTVTCTNSTIGHLHCNAQVSGVVHVECRDYSGRNADRRKLVVSSGASPVDCAGDPASVSHRIAIGSWCQGSWVGGKIDWCSGTLALDANGNQICLETSPATAGTAKANDITVTSVYDTADPFYCIVTADTVIPAPDVPTLEEVGNDGSPTSVFPLQQCQGDCDNDAECAGDLVCFNRGDTEVVPGCIGTGADLDGVDFCVQPSSSSVSVSRLDPSSTEMKLVGDADGSSHALFPLLECEADCDDDDECDSDLVCFHRSGMDTVPGCSGDQDAFDGKDFCVRKELVPP